MMCSKAASVTNVIPFRETISPETKRKLIGCPNRCNISNVTAEFIIDSKHFTCFCSQCDHRWYVCFNCRKQNSHYTSLRQLKRHQSTCQFIINGPYSSLNHSHLQSSFPASSYFSFFEFMEFPHFGRNENRRFYFHNQMNQGLSYLVGWSQFHLPNVSSFLRNEEVHCQVRIADLLHGLKKRKFMY